MNFYEEKLLEIKELIDKDDLKQVLEIINTELNMPYVPKEFEKKLIKIKDQIIFEYSANNSNKNNLSPEKLFLLLNSPSIDLFEKIGLVKELESINIRKYKNEINSLLIDENIEQELKTIIFYVLVDQEFNEDVIIKNIYLNKEFKINPSKVDLKEYEMVPLNIIELLSEELYHYNVQLFEMSKQLTVTIFYKLFPYNKQIDFKEMTNVILKKIYEVNGLVYNKQVDSDYLELINKLKVV